MSTEVSESALRGISIQTHDTCSHLPILQASSQIKVHAVVEVAATKNLLKGMERMLGNVTTRVVAAAVSTTIVKLVGSEGLARIWIREMAVTMVIV